jgi:hypothetical protein
MNHEFSYYVAAFMAAIGIAIFVYGVFAIVRYIIKDVLEVFFESLIVALDIIKDVLKVFFESLIVALVERLFNPVLMFKQQWDFNRKPVLKEPTPLKTNEHISDNSESRKVGEELMAIPAYARKAKGIGYPMTKELLNTTKVINKNSKETLNLNRMKHHTANC